jgi:hypothetical protein
MEDKMKFNKIITVFMCAILFIISAIYVVSTTTITDLFINSPNGTFTKVNTTSIYAGNYYLNDSTTLMRSANLNIDSNFNMQTKNITNVSVISNVSLISTNNLNVTQNIYIQSGYGLFVNSTAYSIRYILAE